MSFFVSKEIKENIDLSFKSLNSLDDDIIDVSNVTIDEKNIIIEYVTNKNMLSKTVRIKKFLLCKKEYSFKQELEFNLLRVKKENTKLAVEIIICKDKFWRYLDNEEY